MFGICELIAGIQSQKHDELMASLTKEEREKILENDAQKAREELLHKRALEIANAVRPRNFWGR